MEPQKDLLYHCWFEYIVSTNQFIRFNASNTFKRSPQNRKIPFVATAVSETPYRESD